MLPQLYGCCSFQLSFKGHLECELLNGAIVVPFDRHVMNRKFGILIVLNISLFTAALLYEVLSHKPGPSALYRRPESSSTLTSHALRQAREVSACSTYLLSASSHAGICTHQQQLIVGQYHSDA